ncbi:MAG TPA: hypothetical protein VLK84_31350 [Longimicrobium sp.]|nr:hypothetical protein [Longimicrobium sp.]
MPHPFSWSESLLVSTRRPVTADEVLDRMERVLRRESVREIQRTETELSFRVGFLQQTRGWSLLAGITAGTVEVRVHPSAVDVRYELDFRQVAWAATAMIALAAFGIYGAQGDSALPPWALLVGWGWLAGGSMGIALARFPRFVRGAIQDVARGPVPAALTALPSAPRR